MRQKERARQPSGGGVGGWEWGRWLQAQEVARANSWTAASWPSLKAEKEASVALAELTSLERLAGMDPPWLLLKVVLLAFGVR